MRIYKVIYVNIVDLYNQGSVVPWMYKMTFMEVLMTSWGPSRFLSWWPYKKKYERRLPTWGIYGQDPCWYLNVLTTVIFFFICSCASLTQLLWWTFHHSQNMKCSHYQDWYSMLIHLIKEFEILLTLVNQILPWCIVCMCSAFFINFSDQDMSGKLKSCVQQIVLYLWIIRK